MTLRTLAVGSLLACSACVGTTGGDLVDFDAFAAGPSDTAADGSYSFRSGRGYDVTLTRARLHVGAIYLNRSQPTSVSLDTSCTLAGIYVAEVLSELDVDALSPELQPFPERGFATTERALTGEVWLTGGDVNDESDPTLILDVAGTASTNGTDYPFEGALTISQNRVVPSEPASPGRHPICKQRIASPIATNLTPTQGGALVLRVEPRELFGNVDFSTLGPDPDDPSVYRFADASHVNQASDNLYQALHSGTVYALEWRRSPP